MLRCLTWHTRLFTTVNHRRRWISVQSGDELYLPGTTPNLQFQAESSNNFGLLAATVIKCFKPFTSAAVLLVQRQPDNGKVILKLADCRLGHRSGKGGPVPWSLSLEGHLRHTVRNIQDGMVPTWFDLICDVENWPDIEPWEDWMWEVSIWHYKVLSHNTELVAYRLLHRLQGCYIPHLFGVVLQEGSRSPAIVDFRQAGIRDPELSDEEWSDAVRGGPDTRYMRLLSNPEDGPWKRTMTPYEISDPHYKIPTNTLKRNDQNLSGDDEHGEQDIFVVLRIDEMQIVSERGGNTREVGSIGEQFTVLPNSSDIDASTPQDPDFVLRRVSSGCDGRSGKEDGHGRWQCSFRVAHAHLTLTTAENHIPLRHVRFGTGEVSALVGEKLDASGTSKGARTVGDPR
ncbi:hypothetical protein ARMGADRAFT_1091001 [Armillaria gallica]|uniref:Uncharacterized protein n=1 Tax=Armillaria gallica TaxID=47427 RepID=A0A2H3CIR7_ARMGA|nr:hypothetical protein ARMGADRAFT_1091001 [Armillaria gallica]